MERIHFPTQRESDNAPVSPSRNIRHHVVICGKDYAGYYPFTPIIPSEDQLIDVHGEEAERLQKELAAEGKPSAILVQTETYAIGNSNQYQLTKHIH